MAHKEKFPGGEHRRSRSSAWKLTARIPAETGMPYGLNRSRNREAFEKLYGEYQKRLFRYFMRLVSVTEAAEELTNDVLVEVWKKAADFRGLSKVSTWIFGIAHHKAMRRSRRWCIGRLSKLGATESAVIAAVGKINDQA